MNPNELEQDSSSRSAIPVLFDSENSVTKIQLASATNINIQSLSNTAKFYKSSIEVLENNITCMFNPEYIFEGSYMRNSDFGDNIPVNVNLKNIVSNQSLTLVSSISGTSVVVGDPTGIVSGKTALANDAVEIPETAVLNSSTSLTIYPNNSKVGENRISDSNILNSRSGNNSVSFMTIACKRGRSIKSDDIKVLEKGIHISRESSAVYASLKTISGVVRTCLIGYYDPLILSVASGLQYTVRGEIGFIIWKNLQLAGYYTAISLSSRRLQFVNIVQEGTNKVIHQNAFRAQISNGTLQLSNNNCVLGQNESFNENSSMISIPNFRVSRQLQPGFAYAIFDNPSVEPQEQELYDATMITTSS